LSAAASESRTSLRPNSLSLRLFFIGVPCDCLVRRLQPSERGTIHRGDRLPKTRNVSRAPCA
jgi:hypothetical protein